MKKNKGWNTMEYKLNMIVEPPPKLYKALEMIRNGIINRYGPIYYKGVEKLYEAIEELINRNENDIYYLNDVLATYKVLCAMWTTARHIEIELEDSPNMLATYKELVNDLEKYRKLIEKLLEKTATKYEIYGWCVDDEERRLFIAFMMDQRDVLTFTVIMFAP